MDVKETRGRIDSASRFYGAEISLEAIAFELCDALEQSQAEVEKLRGALEETIEVLQDPDMSVYLVAIKAMRVIDKALKETTDE